MPDQDQVANPDQPYKFSTTVTDKAEEKPPEKPKKGLPLGFFDMPFEQQQTYVEPDTLPEVTNAQIGRAALTAAPYAAGTGAAILTGWIGMPWYLALIARPGAAYLAGGGAEYGKQEAYKRDWWDTKELAPKDSAEEWQRVRDQAWSQAWPELIGSAFSSIGPARAAIRGKEYLPGGGMYSRGVGKIPQATTMAEKTPILRTGMKYGIMPTEAGAEKAGVEAMKLNTKIDATIAKSPTSYTPQKWTAEVKSRFDKLRDMVNNQGLGSVEDMKVIDDRERDFLINRGGAPNTPVPIWKRGKIVGKRPPTLNELRARAKPLTAERVQQLKKGTWQSVRRKTNPKGTVNVIAGFNQYTNPDLALDAEEEIGRSMRALIGDRYPNINALNEEEGHLFELQRAIAKKAEADSRRMLIDPRGLWKAGVGAAGGAATGAHWGPSGAAIGAVAGGGAPLVGEALLDPRVQARLGILRNRPLTRSISREIIPSIFRGGEYVRGQPTQEGQGPGGMQEIDPSEVQQYLGTGPGALLTPPGPLPEKPQAVALEEEPEPKPTPPPRTGYEPRIEDVPAVNRPVYERERPMKPRDQPLYGWSPQWAKMLESEASMGGVKTLPLSLLHTVAAMEGSGRASEQQKVPPNKVRSKAGAVGLMQVMPNIHGATAEELQDPQLNIAIAASYLRHLNNKYKDRPELVLAAYNAGEEALKNADYKIYNLKKETQDYVTNGMRMWATLSLDPDAAAFFISTIPQRLK